MKIFISISLVFVALHLVQANKHQDEKLHKNIEITPASLVTINDKKYFFSHRDARVDVDTAILLCNNGGMSLVNLETEEEYLAINNYLVNKGDQHQVFWTSGRFLKDFASRLWLWTGSGQVFTYNKWLSGEPSEPPCGMCVSLGVDQGFIGEDCYNAWSFICEST